jgi:hypothetical protein
MGVPAMQIPCVQVPSVMHVRSMMQTHADPDHQPVQDHESKQDREGEIHPLERFCQDFVHSPVIGSEAPMSISYKRVQVLEWARSLGSATNTGPRITRMSTN